MTRSNKEIAEEVLRRVEAIDRRKAVRKQRIRGALAIIAALALTVGAGFAIAAFVGNRHILQRRQHLATCNTKKLCAKEA